MRPKYKIMIASCTEGILADTLSSDYVTCSVSMPFHMKNSVARVGAHGITVPT